MKNLLTYCQIVLLLAAWTPAALAQTPRQEVGNLLTENVPALPAALRQRLDQYQNVRSASFADWAANGQGLYISTRFADVTQVHFVASPGADRQQLTFYPEPITSAAACPDRARNGFVFAKDTGGNENFQLFYFDRTVGQARLLTDGKSRNEGYRWNRRGDKLVYRSNQRTGKSFDFYVTNPFCDGEEKLIASLEGGGWGVADWSADDRYLLVTNYTSVNESRLYRLEVANGKMTQLNPSGRKIAYSDAKFTRDGKGVYWVSDEGGEFAHLRYHDLATNKTTVLTANIPWNVENIDLNETGNLLAFSTNEGGFSRLYTLNTATRQYRPVAALPKGVVGSVAFAPNDNRLALTLTTATAPADVCVLNAAATALTRWTFSELGGLNPARFVSPTLITYPTFDSLNGQPRRIPAFLYAPARATGRVPVVISIHGGPEGQSLPTFNSLVQYMVSELGVAVVVPNVRGSTGYGKTYVALDNGALRENSVRDIGALLDWIGKQPDLDATRVAVYGGSYGGYMVLASMVRYNDRLRAGIDLFGISNWLTFLQNTSEYRRDLRRVEYGDERDPAMSAFLTEISPIKKVNNVTKPMFIFQGVNDPRVPQSESEQMLASLKKNGTAAWYVLAKDEGHGIAKKANRDYTNAAMMLFLEKFLLDKDEKR